MIKVSKVSTKSDAKPLETSHCSTIPKATLPVPDTTPNFKGGKWGGKIFALIVTAQVGALAFFGLPYAQTLAFGKSVVLKCHTYDPHDIFKGDYVAVTYDVSSKVDFSKFKSGDTAYLTLKKGAQYWEPVAATKEMPASLKADEASMKVRFNGSNNPSALVTTGIENFYVPEGKAMNFGSDNLKAEVSLAKDGMPVLKRMLMDGKEIGK